MKLFSIRFIYNPLLWLYQPVVFDYILIKDQVKSIHFRNIQLHVDYADVACVCNYRVICHGSIVIKQWFAYLFEAFVYNVSQ